MAPPATTDTSFRTGLPLHCTCAHSLPRQTYIRCDVTVGALVKLRERTLGVSVHAVLVEHVPTEPDDILQARTRTVRGKSIDELNAGRR
jgi:hypothetical protein